MDESERRTDGQLLAATRHDPEAFALFYRRHVRGVLAFFRRRTSADVALDLTAETFAAALEGSARYTPRPEPARGWLYGIAWGTLHEAQRRGRAEAGVRPRMRSALVVPTAEEIERIEGMIQARGVSAGEGWLEAG
jgi:RNA polymerase sigma-70 factor (ECF subfamily)